YAARADGASEVPARTPATPEGRDSWRARRRTPPFPTVEREIRICDMRDLQRADPTLGGEGGRGRVTGGGMVEQRIERARLFGPGKEIAHLETPGQFAQHPGRRPRLAWRVEHLRHQIKMGVRALAAGSFEP